MGGRAPRRGQEEGDQWSHGRRSPTVREGVSDVHVWNVHL